MARPTVQDDPPREAPPGAAAGAVAEHVLRAVLAADHAVVFALSSAAVRVPLPDDPVLAGAVPLPGDTLTTVDIVRPSDRMEVVRVWEEAGAHGVGQGTVHLLADPEQALTFTIVDARAVHGVFLAVLSSRPEEGGTGEDRGRHPGAISDPALLVARRPRTGTVRKNLGAVITDLDERAVAMLGWPREEMLGHRSLEFIHPEDHERAIAQWMEMRSRRHTERVRVRHAVKGGGWLWVEIENVFVGLDRPDEVVAVAYLTDVSDEMAAHEAVRHREALFRRLADSLPVGVFQWAPDGELVYVNSRLRELVRAADADGEPLTLDRLLAPVTDAGRDAIRAALLAAAGCGADAELEVDAVVPSGDLRTYLVTVAALTDLEGTSGAIVTVTDVTSSARARDELQVRATHDPLTGCLNRSGILARIEDLLNPSDGYPEPVALMFVDLDGFKQTNDTHGHAVGDEVLRAAADRLRCSTRHFDLVGRLGGDEFLVALPGVESIERALQLAERLHDGLQGAVEVAAQSVGLRASIGVSLAHPGVDVAGALGAADHAMYQAKRNRSGVAVAQGRPVHPS